jgi:hypothetical protein
MAGSRAFDGGPERKPGSSTPSERDEDEGATSGGRPRAGQVVNNALNAKTVKAAASHLGPAGTIGLKIAQSRHRKWILLAALASPFGGLIAALMALTFIIGSVASGVGAPGETDALDAAYVSGISQRALNIYQEVSTSTGIPWEVLAAVPAVRGSVTAAGASGGSDASEPSTSTGATASTSHIPHVLSSDERRAARRQGTPVGPDAFVLKPLEKMVTWRVPGQVAPPLKSGTYPYLTVGYASGAALEEHLNGLEASASLTAGLLEALMQDKHGDLPSYGLDTGVVTVDGCGTEQNAATSTNTVATNADAPAGADTTNPYADDPYPGGHGVCDPDRSSYNRRFDTDDAAEVSASQQLSSGDMPKDAKEVKAAWIDVLKRLPIARADDLAEQTYTKAMTWFFGINDSCAQGSTAAIGTDPTVPIGTGQTLTDIVSGANTLDADQISNAQTIIATAAKVFPAQAQQAAVVGITTALTESTLHTDPGSLGGAYGLFQQTPPGWGTKAQVMDPAYAANKFFSALQAVPGWDAMQPYAAAQAVQRSGAGRASGGLDNYGPNVARAQQIVATYAGSLSGSIIGASAGNCGGAGGSLIIGTLNALGANHSAPCGHAGQHACTVDYGDANAGHQDNPIYPGYKARLDTVMASVDADGVGVVGLQEFEMSQVNYFTKQYGDQWGMYPGGTTPSSWRAQVQNSVIWNKSQWEVATGADGTPVESMVTYPYRFGQTGYGALVELKSVTSGATVWVLNVHNPANKAGENNADDRAASVAKEIAAFTKIRATDPDSPILFTGDMNASASKSKAGGKYTDFYCQFTTAASAASLDFTPALTATSAETNGSDAAAATQPSVGGGGECDPPDTHTIDWILGNGGMQFSGYTEDASVHKRHGTDHPALNYVTVAFAGTGGSVGFGVGQGEFTQNSAVVGHYSDQQLWNRAQKYAAATSGWIDSGIAGSYSTAQDYTEGPCQHFVANLSGYSSSGFSTARSGWAHYLAAGQGHFATGTDGLSPPIGAELYYDTSNSAGHVVIYLGSNKVISSDMGPNGKYDPGHISIVDEAAVRAWGSYLGWAPPNF